MAISSPRVTTASDVAGEATARLEHTDTTALIRLSGDWLIGNTPRFTPPDPTAAPPRQLHVDADGVNDWDSSLVSYALQARRWGEQAGIDFEARLPEGAASLLALAVSVPPAAASTEAAPGSWLARLAIGDRLASLGSHVSQALEFIGNLIGALLRTLLGRARVRTRDILSFSFQAGPSALPIIGLTSVLVGMILGYLGAVQLQEFGAGIYVADLVTIGMLREMGPLMAAVIMSGRTGAAYAAQLGTMRVNEEVDAIEILGVSVIEFLVVPRILGLFLMLPLLVIYANALGILGGGIVAIGLGITPLQYSNEVDYALTLNHLFVGLVKAAVFAVLIGIAGCRAGLSSARNSAGVGRATTTAVVNALVYLIVADAAINIVCQILDI